MHLHAFQRRVHLTWAMVPCRLYELVYHSFVMSTQERDQRDLRQPTKIIMI